ncbi:MAG TPA: hypothetical protein VGI03_08500, partial [Verrucomicrobiae bacterium]
GRERGEAVFLGFGVVSAPAFAKGYGVAGSHRVFKHVSSPKPRQNTQNPRSERPHCFLKRSGEAKIYYAQSVIRRTSQ